MENEELNNFDSYLFSTHTHTLSLSYAYTHIQREGDVFSVVQCDNCAISDKEICKEMAQNKQKHCKNWIPLQNL